MSLAFTQEDFLVKYISICKFFSVLFLGHVARVYIRKDQVKVVLYNIDVKVMCSLH